MNNLFEHIIKMEQDVLKDFLNAKLSKLYGSQNVINQDGFLYAEGNIPVMLLSHMDTVHRHPVSEIVKSKDQNVWMSPQGIGGDDRCGVFIILSLLLSGYRPHVLFLEDEEIGGIGASKFTRTKISPYLKYMIEFDRRGRDEAVYYDCENSDFIQYIADMGFEESIGSFSDISIVAPHLGVAAVNLSCGCYNCHTIGEYIVISQVNEIIAKSKSILDDINDSDHFVYIECKRSYSLSGFSRGRTSYYDEYYEKFYASRPSIYDEYSEYEEEEYDEEKLTKYSGEKTSYYEIERSFGGEAVVKFLEEEDVFVKDEEGDIRYFDTFYAPYVDVRGCVYIDSSEFSDKLSFFVKTKYTVLDQNLEVMKVSMNSKDSQTVFYYKEEMFNESVFEDCVGEKILSDMEVK